MEADAQTRATIVTGDEAQQVTPSKTETTNTFLTEHLLIPTPLRREVVRPLPEAMVAALDIYKCRTEGVCSKWAIEEDAQSLSGTVVAALTRFLFAYRSETSTTPITPEPLTLGLNVRSTFVVKEVKTYVKGRGVREIWTIEDVVSKQVCSVPSPVALLTFSIEPYDLLNIGVIPILECATKEWGMVNPTFTFSLASLADGRKTDLYTWKWCVSGRHFYPKYRRETSTTTITPELRPVGAVWRKGSSLH